jgi:hypothetical protein
MLFEQASEGEAQRATKGLSIMVNNEYIQRYYSAVVGSKRINGPSFDEASKDLARATARILVF